MSLSAQIDNSSTDIHAIAAYLDGLDGQRRWDEVGKLDRDRQRMLWEKAAQSAPLDLGYFVGEAAPRTEVIHDGLNTLPLPTPLRRFQKRFARPIPNGHSPRLFGYNEGPTRQVVGPGFFVTIPTKGTPHWESRGGVVVDYWQVPDGEVPAGWPKVVPNDWRLQKLVYFQTRDFMRRVSKHVSIGAAFKKEKPLDHYFVLCRRG